MKIPSRPIMVGAAVARRLCSAAAAAETTQRSKEVTLYRRLSALGATGGSVSKTVNQYLREGKAVKKHELVSCIKDLRKYKRYSDALELMEWMERRGINLSYGDFAVRLELLSKTEGLASAEKYFDGLYPFAKNQSTYGALLNCYCTEKVTEKALALFEKVAEMKLTSNPLAYNNLMTMYMKLGKPEMVPPLVQEMKARNILPDSFTYGILLQSCAALKNLEEVERTMEVIEEGEESKKCDWTLYSNLAAIYIEAGLFKKAELALRELEKRMRYWDRIPYHYLISFYARTGNLLEINRVWGSLKSVWPVTNNTSYLVMLQALSKLGDFDGLKECFDEWESHCSIYDMRLANIIVAAYLKLDMIEEAELVCNRAIEKGSRPNFRTWEIFMDFFLRIHRIDLAVRCMEGAISKVKESEWYPKQERVVAFLQHFEEEKDVNGAEEFCRMLKKINCSLNSDTYHLLLNTYIVAGKTSPEMRRRMKDNGIEMNSELEDLLERVSPE